MKSSVNSKPLVDKEFARKLLQSFCDHENSYIPSENFDGSYKYTMYECITNNFGETSDGYLATMCCQWWTNDIQDWAKSYNLSIKRNEKEKLVVIEETTIELKSWPQFFQAIKGGYKTHDLRRKDREFYSGQELVLKEFDPNKGEYTGDSVRVEVTYITSNEFPCAYSSHALDNDYCILSLRVIG